MNAEQKSIYTPDHPAVIASLEALSFGRTSWEAKRDECYAWQRVKENADPNAGSNVGQQNILYEPSIAKRRRARYLIRIRGNWPASEGSVRMHAPETLSEARDSPLLAQAAAKRDNLRAALIAKYGDPKTTPRTIGLFAEIRKVLAATPDGTEWLARSPSCISNIGMKISTAAAYEYDGWNRDNPFYVHLAFNAQPDCRDLIKLRWSCADATAEVTRRRVEKLAAPQRDPYTATPARPSVASATSMFVPKLVGNPSKLSPAAIQVLKDEWIDRSKALDALGLYDEMTAVFDDLQQFEDDESIAA